jgi:hypothetical protein
MYFFISNHFGVVAAAIYGDVDCEDYIPHFRLGLSSMVFEHKTITLNRASLQHKDWAHPTGKGRSGLSGSRKRRSSGCVLRTEGKNPETQRGTETANTLPSVSVQSQPENQSNNRWNQRPKPWLVRRP